MKPLSELSAAQLNKAFDKANVIRDAITAEMIAVGRGRELSSETLTRRDPLSVRFAEASYTLSNLLDEKRNRMTYHGSLKPIKQVA